MSEWKRISKLGPPKKGVDVQVYCEDTEEQFVAFFMAPGRYQYAQKKGITFSCNPSHWQPLTNSPPKEH